MKAELLTIGLKDYLTYYKKEAENYELKGIEYSGRARVCSGANLKPIKSLEKKVKREFIERLPKNTEVVIGIKKEIIETPSGFFSEGLQYVSYSGTALVLKN